MASFDWRNNIEDSLKDGVIITIGATRIFLGLKALNVVKPPKTSKLDAMDIMTLTRGICGAVFIERSCSIQKMDERVNITKTTKI